MSAVMEQTHEKIYVDIFIKLNNMKLQIFNIDFHKFLKENW